MSGIFLRKVLISKLNPHRASQVVLVVKNPPANAGDARDIGLIHGWEDPLEKEMATHSSILAWRIPWTEEPGGLQSMGSTRDWQDWSELAHSILTVVLLFLSSFLDKGLPMWLSGKESTAMQETWIQSLEKSPGEGNPKLVWETPWTEKPGRLQSMGLQKYQTRLSN